MGGPREALRHGLIVAAGAVCLLLIAGSVRQVVFLAGREIPYPGAKALSAPWAPPPPGDTDPWTISVGIEAPSLESSTSELRAWLERHYPVLALDIPAGDVQAARGALRLGGGPPRVLFVEPGVGLVMRVPRD